jgi:YbgC/YbaW family acyl-CoA thioester hydrolase
VWLVAWLLVVCCLLKNGQPTTVNQQPTTNNQQPTTPTPMPYEHTSTRRIEFSETDMAGLVHFSNFFKYMETAERDFFEAAGVDLIHTQPGELVGWPRARAECKFTAPLRFGDTIDIHLAVKAVKDRSIDYQFRIFRIHEDGSRTQAAKAQITTILTKLTESGDLQSVEIPVEVRARITEAPTDVLARPLGI